MNQPAAAPGASDGQTASGLPSDSVKKLDQIVQVRQTQAAALHHFSADNFSEFLHQGCRINSRL